VTVQANIGEKYRVMIVNSALYIGGAENVTAALCRGLNRNLFDISVVHLKGHGQIAKDLEREGYEVIGLPPRKSGRRDLLTFLKLRHLMAERRVQLVHTQDIHAMVDASLSVMTLPHIKHVTTFHYGNYPRNNRRYHYLEKFFHRFPDRLIAVGEVQRQSIAQTYHLESEALSVIRNGVTDSYRRARIEDKDRVRQGADVVIGSISTLIEQKGIDDLLKAARILADQGLKFRLVIVGDGHLRGALEAYARELNLNGYVEFLGWIEDAASRVLPWLDIFVQSSLWEAMSMVVLEAMSCRCAVVATTVGDNPYVIRDGQSGALVSSNAPKELAASLCVLIGDSEMRMRFAEQARRDYEANYTASRMCLDYEAMYLNVIRGADIKVDR